MATPPEQFICPICAIIMTDPVILSGMTCDRQCIEPLLNSGGNTCPVTKRLLSHTVLVPNREMRGMIMMWHENDAFEPLEYNPDYAVDLLVMALFEDRNLTPLINMLENDRLKANQARAITEGLVEVAMVKLKNQVLVSEMLETLALLSTNLNSIKGMVKMDAIPCLFEILRENPGRADMDRCMRILYSILSKDINTFLEMLKEENLLNWLKREGTSRTKHKARQILWTFKRIKEGRLITRTRRYWDFT